MDRQLRVPPLDPQRFEGSFKHFCTIKRLVPDRKLLHVEGKDVRLHALHEGVMIHKGRDTNTVRALSLPHSRPIVTLTCENFQNDPNFWLKVATSLEFTQSQDATPTALEVADRLAMIYRYYLEEFDGIYVMSFDQEVAKRAVYGRR